MSFRLAKLDAGGMTPQVLELDVADAEVFPFGALLVKNTSGKWAECGADPAAVGAVALSGYGNSLAFGALRTDGFPTGRMQGVLVRGGTRFLAPYVGALGTIGTSYGTIVDSDGEWKVDFNETGTVQVKYLRSIQTDNLGLPPLVEVVFLAAAVQEI